MTNTITISRMRAAVLAALAAIMLVMGTALPAQADMVRSVSIDSLRSEILSKYDRNSNNAINLPAERTNRKNPSASFQTMALFLDADRDCNLKATRNEITRLLRFFDANRNGNLNGAELSEFVALYGGGGVVRGAPVAATKADIEDFVDRTFCAYDHSRDGLIQLDDTPPGADNEIVSFDQVNIFSGLLEASDADFDRIVTPAELDALVRSFDTNGDGFISNHAATLERDNFVNAYGTGGVL